MSTADTYGPQFFRSMGAVPDENSKQVLSVAFNFLKPDSVIDVGCGTGKWVATALMLGAGEGLGIDGAYVPREQRIIPPNLFIEHDLESTPLALDRKFDMAICLEVVEHLSRKRSESIIPELCGLSDLILFSAAPPFQVGTHHVNEQWLEYWGILFRREQFVAVDVIRDQIWLNSEIEWYYRQNVIFFCRETTAVRLFPRGKIVLDGLLTRLHPEMLLASIAKFWPFMYGSAYYEEVYHYHLLANAWLSGATELPPAGHRDSAIVDSRLSLPAVEILKGNGNGENNRICVAQPLALEFAGGELTIGLASGRPAMQESIFSRSDNLWPSVVSFYGDGEQWLGQALTDFFDSGALTGPRTELCRIMTEEKSDKGSGWHNYTLLYDFLFRHRRYEITSLFEVGIGTYEPGASLRGWRRYFPRARIFGADFDTNTLFFEERISTFYVDQLRAETVHSLWRNFPSECFDIILDDGLHTFEANSTFFLNSVQKLKPNGYYIIEDIIIDNNNLDKYHKFFSDRSESGVIIKIPNDSNNFDNCLGIFRKASVDICKDPMP